MVVFGPFGVLLQVAFEPSVLGKRVFYGLQFAEVQVAVHPFVF